MHIDMHVEIYFNCCIHMHIYIHTEFDTYICVYTYIYMHMLVYIHILHKGSPKAQKCGARKRTSARAESKTIKPRCS